MGWNGRARISLVTEDESVLVSGGDRSEWEGIKLNEDPDGMFDTEVELKTIDVAGMPGGFDGGEETPVRTLTLPFNCYDMGDGIEATISRLRRLLWRRTFEWHYETEYSGLRWLKCKRSKSIKVNPKRDWNIDNYALATVEAVALNPDYESEPHQVIATNPSAGENTVWVPAWNPTDRPAWPIWSIKPNGGECQVSLPDFSFGNEQEIDQTGNWQPGDHADRMITLEPTEQFVSVMAHPMMDPYVASDLSNFDGQMGAVEPLYWIPEYTASEDDPVMLPVIIDGPAGAQVKLRLRRFWSAEMGGE
ncbi:hypothetical protein [Gordonia sp. ABSL49_1]|uniref:hypothetical protein n=1 Tax=Gordonia sp. ABSL49_1 TaxID=2920941 RepID=UPI001F107F7E|nr:hypothetical protein [Gordonia sp. ABSL49_1]MCH5645170.1 hypothetical protein [Gordonia sp. ABSL49_1]